jgi:hypothetical protein
MEVRTLGHAHWEVRWVHNRRVVVIDCGDDLAEAVRIYTLALRGSKLATTLRCKNVGFPPPARLRAVHERRAADGIERIPHLYFYNLRGWWWCPYCMQVRKFRLLRGFHDADTWVPTAGYHCPMCKISHRDGCVRKWNPLAARLYVEGVRAHGHTGPRSAYKKRGR